MKIQQLNKISKLYFGYREISRVLGITEASARVLACRYAERGFLVRVKRNVYVLAGRWESLSAEEGFEVANVLQVPSYISLMTALSYYGITTQVQRGTVESISLRRTVDYDVKGRMFLYTRISKNLYGGFSRQRGFFISSAEKAFLDAVYLKSISRYKFDITSIDISKLDSEVLRDLSGKYPERTRKLMEDICKT